jgi:hypothetical protein
MKLKVRSLLMLLLLTVSLFITVPVYAEDEVVDLVEEDVESNFISKEYYIEGEDDSNYLVEGGNEDAVNMLATEQSTASGTVRENSNIEGEDFDMTLPSDEDYEEKNPLELRQFISFETKSGKVFHLIIDHGKESDNVTMLTEVSEQDLLNLIEEQADIEIGLIEGSDQVNEGREKESEDHEEETENTVAETDESAAEDGSMDTQIMIIIGVAVISGIAGWYFKIHKPKQEAMYEDEVDEAEYIDDELINEDQE